VLNILKIRENEETAVKLSVSIYNTERNEKRQQYEAMVGGLHKSQYLLHVHKEIQSKLFLSEELSLKSS